MVSDVRVADGEMCAIPAWKYAVLDAATAPEVDGPRTAITFGSPMNFCATDWAGAGPCSTGVSPTTSVARRPILGASVLTAYFAQLSCSVPRKPAPPVTGVTKPILNGALQLILDDFAEEAVFSGRADAAVTTASASAAAANGRMNLSLRIWSPCDGGFGGSYSVHTRTPSAGYSLASYALFAGLPDGWKTPRTRIGVGPVFSRQCSWSGGRWMHEPGPIGVSLPARWRTPSPSTT